jgi:hypothetical protein
LGTIDIQVSILTDSLVHFRNSLRRAERGADAAASHLQGKVNSLRRFLALLPLLAISGASGPAATVQPGEPPPAFLGLSAATSEQLLSALAVQTSPAANGARPHGFYFSRAMYGAGDMGRWRRGRAWATDFPKADLQFLTVLHRLLPTLDAGQTENPLALTDPELRRFPYLYAVEVGNMDLTEEEVTGLRNYLLAGGFMFVDDFWGSREWEVFEYQLRRVFPDRPIVDLPLDHPIFNTYYEIDEIIQVPVVGSACSGGPTWERDGYVPAVRAVLDDQHRVMVLISWNSDLGDAWEWAEQSCYPLEYSTYAFQLAVNTIVYAMSR